MAKVSGDDSSWKANGLAKKYEDWENNPKHKPASSKNKRKNTKRWCRGKEGKEHAWVSYKPYTFMRYRIRKCSECGKTDWTYKFPDL